MRSLRKYREFVGDDVWRLFRWSCFIGFILFVAESSFVLVLQGFLLALQLVPEDRLLLPSWYPRGVVGAMLLLVAFGFVRGLVVVAKAMLGGLTNQAFMQCQRARVMEFALRRAGETSVAEMVALFTDRISQVGGAFNNLSQAILFATSTLFLLGTAAYLAPIELTMGVALLGIFLLPLRALNRHIAAAGEGIVREWNDASRSLVQGLRHHFFFKVYNMIDEEASRGEKSLGDYARHFKAYYRFASVKNALPMIVGVIVVSVIAIVSREYIGTSPAGLVSFFYVFIRIANGGSEFAASMNDLRVQRPNIRALFSFWERYSCAPPRIEQPLSADDRGRFLALLPSGITIDVKNLSFRHGEGPLLEGISLTVRPGERLVVQGESGTGKSTLLSLILGVLQPQKGVVLVNGFSVESVREELALVLGYVGPEPFLIQGTVRENLLFGLGGRSTVNDLEIWDALRKARIDDTVQQLAGGLDEVLKEHTQLSTGQKQRLSIARALLRRPRLLVLDEATANLDPATERSIVDSLEPLFAGMAVIVISHKDAFNRVATRSIRLGRSS